MPLFSSDDILYEHGKKAKDKVRKCGGSVIRKTLKLGQEAGVFTATIHYNPTYGQLDGAVHVPEGQSIPDVKQLLLDLYHGRQHIDRRRRSRATRPTARHQRRESTPILDEITVETSDSENQKLPTVAVDGGDTGDTDADPQLASGGDQHDAGPLEAKAVTAGLQGSLGDAVYKLTDDVNNVDNANVDADDSPEATCNATESAGSGTDSGISDREDLIAQGTCGMKIGCRTSKGSDFGWLGLQLPESTENGPALSDWLVVGMEETLNAGGPSEDAEGPTLRNMRTKSMGQCLFFERVSKQLWRAKQDRTAAEIAAGGGSSDGGGDVFDDDHMPEESLVAPSVSVARSKLSPRAVEERNESEFECQDYSPSTTALLNNVEEQYCEILDRDPRHCYQTLSMKLLYNFFDWYLSQKVDKEGRERSGIKKKSSLGTYWKIFRLVFESAVGERIASKLGRSMRKYVGVLSRHNRFC
ncbi:C2H2 finger domain-containing protein [Colletotrichum tofieldiae]|uniref:C2H2 finger domain-containing protein n=1 Tax=Colletotrichum tofieldiae TaxID=708197 RepID=A0A166SAY0_9PEZI|nr:C2H2 finger domain-containing protein [Colletotrichum tofieldiae]